MMMLKMSVFILFCDVTLICDYPQTEGETVQKPLVKVQKDYNINHQIRLNNFDYFCVVIPKQTQIIVASLVLLLLYYAMFLSWSFLQNSNKISHVLFHVAHYPFVEKCQIQLRPSIYVAKFTSEITSIYTIKTCMQISDVNILSHFYTLLVLIVKLTFSTFNKFKVPWIILIIRVITFYYNHHGFCLNGSVMKKQSGRHSEMRL